MGITIVIITHAMNVVSDICKHVAIMEHGVVQEQGLVSEVFAHPKSDVGKRLVLKDVKGEGLEELKTSRVFRITFDHQSAFEPIIANAIRKFDTPINILGATTKNVKGIAVGEMLVGLPADHEADILKYFAEHHLGVEEVSNNG